MSCLLIWGPNCTTGTATRDRYAQQEGPFVATNERLAAQIAILATQLTTAAQALLADEFNDTDRHQLAEALREVADATEATS